MNVGSKNKIDTHTQTYTQTDTDRQGNECRIFCSYYNNRRTIQTFVLQSLASWEAERTAEGSEND